MRFIDLVIWSVLAWIGYVIGLEHGSPVEDVTEIVWLADHGLPINLGEAFDIRCEYIPQGKRIQ